MSTKRIVSIVAPQVIATIACMIIAAIATGYTIHDWLTESPPIEIAISGGISVLMFGFSLISSMWLGVLNLSMVLATKR